MATVTFQNEPGMKADQRRGKGLSTHCVFLLLEHTMEVLCSSQHQPQDGADSTDDKKN